MGGTTLSVGVAVTTDPWCAEWDATDVVSLGKQAEDMGLDSVWIGDHLVYRRPMLDSLVVLAAIAGATRRIRLATSVLLPALRQPGLLLKQLASIQALAGNRLILGVGVGGELQDEWNVAGVPLNGRGARTDAIIEAIAAAFSGTAVDPDLIPGALAAEAAGFRPRPQVPELWVGGRSSASVARALRHRAGWFPMLVSPQRIGSELQTAAGADRVLRTGVMLPVAADGEEADRYCRTHFDAPYAQVRQWTADASAGPGGLADRLGDYAAAGVENFVLLPMARHPETLLPVLAGARDRLRGQAT